jgi:hypothetical protein
MSRPGVEHHGDRDAKMTAIDPEALGDLRGQFASGSQHQDAASLASWLALFGGQAMEDRQGECRRLAGARLGDAEQIGFGEHGGNGLRLDRRRGRVAFVVKRLENRRSEAELCKIHEL